MAEPLLADVLDHAVAVGDDDVVEAQHEKDSPTAEKDSHAFLRKRLRSTTADSGYDDETGNAIGIVMIACLVMGFICFAVDELAFFGLIFMIAATVLSSAVTCGYYCGSKLSLNPKVGRLATATLLCLVLLWILVII